MANDKWTIDPAHSSIEFQVKHMMVSKVKGAFNDFEADVEMDLENLQEAKANFKVKAASVDTRQPQRDNHLKSEDFFDVEKYPDVLFQSKEIIPKGDNEYDVKGDLTIRDVTNTIMFHLTYEGSGKDPNTGKMIAGFEITGKFNRKDFGLNYNAALETGGVLIGDEVKLDIQIEASKQ
ncbi:YceI family protein [Listeria sp. PSOL-1]|uniref:YceI family protein n=1 Tax=Listeria sp. PSOL-1 TaxID=1844999 RepID=UPI0013D1942A|nr:YceI family protein [Listeria sp. PSOL-1]